MLKEQTVMKVLFLCPVGALSDMPAVQAFAMYAGMSLLINFVLQMTLFVALFSLDVMREEVRLVVFLCIQQDTYLTQIPSCAISCY